MIEKLESIVIDLKFPIKNDVYVSIKDLPAKVIDPLRNYIFNLPGYNPKNKFNQAGEVREQHGFITMQLTRVFGSLADAYGHIMRTNIAEVDVKDVVLNRRILVVLLPALEKSPEELANLGKVIVASLKAMMASGLGDQVEGKFIDVISKKPTNSSSPFVCILDEYGYYAVRGFAIVAAQARSLGFSAIFAGQDLPAFQKASKEEAASIGANCNIKICMKLEDPLETWDYFNKTAGETYVTNVSGFQLPQGSIALNYLDNRATSVERRQRIELLDLKDQKEGEAHIFFRSQLVRAKIFFANPKPVEELKVNQLLKVEKPDPVLLMHIATRLNNFIEIFKHPAKFYEKVKTCPLTEDLKCIQVAINNSPIEANAVERGVEAVAAILEAQIQKHLKVDRHYQGANSTQTNIFSTLTKPARHTIELLAENLPFFMQPLLKASNVLEVCREIEYLSKKDSIQAAEQTAHRLLLELTKTSSFPADQTTINNILTERDKIFLDSLNDLLMLLGLDPVARQQPENEQEILPILPRSDQEQGIKQTIEEEKT